jgi:hypothetical protein
MSRPPEKNNLQNETQLDPTQKERSQDSQEQKKGKEEIPCFTFAHESDSQSESTPQLCPNSLLYRIWFLVTYTPHRCRWDPANPVKFSWALTVLFGFATTFTVSSYLSLHFYYLGGLISLSSLFLYLPFPSVYLDAGPNLLHDIHPLPKTSD